MYPNTCFFLLFTGSLAVDFEELELEELELEELELEELDELDELVPSSNVGIPLSLYILNSTKLSSVLVVLTTCFIADTRRSINNRPSEYSSCFLTDAIKVPVASARPNADVGTCCICLEPEPPVVVVVVVVVVVGGGGNLKCNDGTGAVGGGGGAFDEGDPGVIILNR